jgi:hypothetical protein
MSVQRVADVNSIAFLLNIVHGMERKALIRLFTFAFLVLP